MRWVACFALLTGLMALAGNAAGADDTDKLKKLLDKAIAAQGGEEKLLGHNAVYLKWKGTAPDGEVTIREYYIQHPDKLRVEIHRGKDQKTEIIRVIDGDKGWVRREGKTEDLSGDIHREARQMIHRLRTTLIPRTLRDTGVKLSALDAADVGGVKAEGVKVAREGHGDLKVYFNPGTGQLLKLEHKGKDESGKAEGTWEFLVKNAKDVGGVKVPTNLEVRLNNKPFRTIEIQEFKVQKDKFPDAKFAKP